MSHLHYLQIRNKQLHCFRKEALSIWFKTPGSYPFNQKFRKFWNKDKWWGNFQGKFLGNPEIAEFPNIHPKIISQGCPLFLNLQKIMLHSSMAIFRVHIGIFHRKANVPGLKISSDEWNSISPNIRKRRQPDRDAHPNFRRSLTQNFRFIWFSLWRFVKFWVEYFAFPEIEQLSGKFV